MATPGSFARFGAGLTAGVLLTALAGIALALAGQHVEAGDDLALRAGAAAAWVWRNLGWSLPVFGVVFTLYVLTLDRLRTALAREAPANEVAQADHLCDIWTSLFFGVGVIWTAVGMRGALVQALGGPAGGAGVEVLQRMVDGGILLALSTTIFGGVGGYLMRAWKALVAGADLKRCYTAEARRDLGALRVSVSAIERRLAGAAADCRGGPSASAGHEDPP